MYIVNKGNPQLLGSKAANLMRVAKNFKVPEFVVISAAAQREYVTSKVMALRFKQQLEKTLRDFLKKGAIAIRSSGTSEDLPGISFAGMYLTVLNIRSVDAGIRAVVDVWQSAESPRIREYCRQMNVGTGDMAVIIQHQLNPEVSGIIVTQSPFSISEVLIECCPGLGDRLVAGEIVPTRYRIRSGKVIEHKGSDLLSSAQLKEIMATGKRIERIFGSAQDIEWSIENGMLYILQSRPVFVHAKTQRRMGTVWCNANVRETIPDPISPMTWSMFDTSFFPGIMIDVFGFPINEEQYRQFRPVEMLSGRLYWNMNNTLTYGKPIGPLLDSIRGDRAIDPQMATAFRAVDVNNLPKIMSGFRMLAFSVVALTRLSYYLTLAFFRYGWMSNKIKKTNSDMDLYCANFLPSEDMAVAVNKVRSWMRIVLKRFARRYFGGIFLGSFYLAVLGGLLSMRMGKKGEVLARRAIIGIIDKTGEMAIAINHLAGLARRKLRVVNIASIKRLYTEDKKFHAEVDRFMNDFGHRGPAEFDVASLNWREDYDMLYSIIAAAKDSSEYSIQREEVIDEILESARPYERFVLRKFLPRLEAFIPLRENGKHYYLKATAKTKDQLLLFGERLAKEGYIEQRRDVFFLTMRDLDGVIDRRYTKKEVIAVVKQRKKQWHEYQLAEVPDIIYESGERITSSVQKSNILLGEPLSSGKIVARARIVDDFSQIRRLKQGEILVTHHADPGWTPLFTIASGLIVEVGGVICHAAMVARELGLPAISVVGATSLIRDGSIIEMDADEGRVVLR